MTKLTQKELEAINDKLENESELIEKYRCLAGKCDDKKLSELCKSAADIHQKHFNMLISYLR